MAARTLAALSAGASRLVLAPVAAAQDHSGHAGHSTPVQTPAPNPHAGHAMPAQTPAAASVDHSTHDMSAMDHGADHEMTSALGPWSMSRDASGTSWQPDMSEHGGIHVQQGDWSIMSHALINLTWDRQNGPRGDDKTFVSGMLMTSARRDFSDGSTLNLRAMLSPDPLMGKDGFPLPLAAGETADELLPAAGGGHGALFAVAKASIGAVHDWTIAPRVRFGLGGLYTINRVPAGLEPFYGGDPHGRMIFVRLKID